MIYDINGDKLILDQDLTGVFPVFNPDDIFTKSSVETIPASMSEFYALYDAFLTQTNVTRNLLGYGSKADGTQDTTLPIYEYVIGNPIQLENTARISPAPLVLLTSGIHSDEKTAMMALYNFVAALFDSTNEVATKIRNSVMFRIVPLINPWGYDATTTQNEGRLNARGVNLNRNFFPYWNNGDASVRGTAPYSELETKALKNWIDTYAPRALFHIDFHNHGMSQSAAFFYVATNNKKQKAIFSVVSRGSRPYFSSTFGINYSPLNRYSEGDSIAGLSAECDEVLGVDSSIVEMPYGSGVTVSNNYIRRECEFAGTLINEMLKNYTYHDRNTA